MSNFTPDLGPWKAFGPTWTNLTVGNGIDTSFYKKLGKLVFVRHRLTFGTTTAVTGLITISRPVPSVNYGGGIATPHGIARFNDSSAALVLEGLVSYIAGNVTDIGLVSYSVSGTSLSTLGTSASSPFVWAVSDELFAQYMYEAA